MKTIIVPIATTAPGSPIARPMTLSVSSPPGPLSLISEEVEVEGRAKLVDDVARFVVEDCSAQSIEYQPISVLL